jgi:nicotinamidase-related amidase
MMSAASSVGVPAAPLPPRKTALLIIDMQYDFCPPTGSLKVDGATDALQVRCRWWESVHVMY